MKTSERILIFSLELFNTHGEANVSSVDISNELDISPGNLYYHFKGKEIIITALFDMYQNQMGKALLASEENSFNLEEFFYYLLVVFDVSHTFRFLYRNPAEIAEKYPAIAKGFTRILDAKEKVFQNFLEDFSDSQLLAIDPVQTKQMVELISMIGSQSTNYQLLKGKDINDGLYIKQSLLQILFALTPFMTIDKSEIDEIKSVIEGFDIH